MNSALESRKGVSILDPTFQLIYDSVPLHGAQIMSKLSTADELFLTPFSRK